jgi:aminoglycoside N3'-acetyltransferase
MHWRRVTDQPGVWPPDQPPRERLGEVLQALGVLPGDLVYLHTSFSRLRHLGLQPDECLDALVAYLGSSGTLVLPSFAWNLDRTQRPWHGYAEYYRVRPIFDVRRTPANIGLLPELFRTRPGVRRSVHAWWSIAALGPLAEKLTVRQEDIAHPYDPDSAFGQLERLGAKVVGLGVSLNTTSLAPVVDYQLGDRHPQVVFSTEPQEGVVVNEVGRTIVTQSYALLPDVVRLIQPSEVIGRSGGLNGRLRRLDISDAIHFAYRAIDYTAEALELATEAVTRGARLPWLERYPHMRGTPALGVNGISRL